MDGFGPYGLSVIKTADLGSSMDGFGPNEKKQQNCRMSAVLWMVWALENACQQNCGPWQFYGWFWHSEEETAQVSNINGFIIKFGLWYYSWLSFGIALSTKHEEKHMQLPYNDQYVL